MTSARSGSRLRHLLALVMGAAAGFLIWQFIPGAFSTRTNPSVELAQTLSEPDFIRRIAGVAEIFEHASPDALDDLRQIIESHPAGPQDSERVLFVEWWSGFDPPAAYAWAADDDLRHGQALVQRVLRVWSRTDPLAALEHTGRPSVLGAVGADPASAGLAWLNESELAVMAGWVESEVPGLEEWVFDQPDMARQQAYAQFLARNYVAFHGAEVAWNWAQSFPDPHGQSMLLATAGAIASRDPQEASRLSTPLIESGQYAGLAPRITARWCIQDPSAALEWVSAEPDTRGREEAVLECARGWISHARADFLRFVDDQPDPFPTWLSPVVRLYARSLVGAEEYSRGLELTARLEETRIADTATIVILRKWLKDDSAAAEAWIEGHSMPSNILERARTLTEDSSP